MTKEAIIAASRRFTTDNEVLNAITDAERLPPEECLEVMKELLETTKRIQKEKILEAIKKYGFC